jgi:membrane-bound lytic murein transglycosylase MltF
MSDLKPDRWLINLTRLKHFEEDRKNSADEYGAELIYRTINRIEELERDKQNLIVFVDELEAENKKLKRVTEHDANRIEKLEAELKQLRLLVYSPDMENDDD